jgi:hypothetical protein
MRAIKAFVVHNIEASRSWAVQKFARLNKQDIYAPISSRSEWLE